MENIKSKNEATNLSERKRILDKKTLKKVANIKIPDKKNGLASCLFVWTAPRSNSRLSRVSFSPFLTERRIISRMRKENKENNTIIGVKNMDVKEISSK